MKDRLESARGWHRLSFIVSATALILLWTPRADPGPALSEALALKSLTADAYHDWVRTVILSHHPLLPECSNWDLYARGQGECRGRSSSGPDVPSFLTWQVHFPFRGDPTSRVIPIVDGDVFSASASLEEWREWITSDKTAVYHSPEWQTATSDDSQETLYGTKTPEHPPLIRHFLVYQAPAGVPGYWPGLYEYRAYVDLEDLPSGDWWTELDGLNRIDLWQRRNTRTEGQRIMWGHVSSEVAAMENTGISQWLDAINDWPKLASQDRSTVLPAMLENWSELRDRRLDDAIDLLEMKQRNSEHDLSLLGFEIPVQLCIAAIPFAYLAMFLLMCLDVASVRHSLASARGLVPTPVAWFAIYDGRLAKWVTTASLTVFPVTLSTCLLARFGVGLSGNAGRIAFATGVVSIVAALWAGLATNRDILEIRKTLQPDAADDSGKVDTQAL